MEHYLDDIIHNKDDIKFVTEFPCFLGHPVYRPNSAPYANIKYFNQTISDIFSKFKSDPNLKNVNEVTLVGDMNINLLNNTKQMD